MKLPDAANYTWSTTIDDDARTYAVDGQTDRASDLSLVNMPVVAALRRRVSSAPSSSVDLATVAFKGDEVYAIQTDKGWKNAGEIAAMSPANANTPYGGYPGGWGGMRRGRRGMMGGMGRGFPPPDDSGTAPNGDQNGDGRQPPHYSNLQKTLSRPHEEVGIIVAGASDLKVEDGDVMGGTLSETAAKLLLVHAGQKEITPLKASGTFRFWVKDGALVKYEVKLEGRIAVVTNGDRHEIDIHQTAMTEIKSVGVTKFDVPDEAKKKLGIAIDPAPPAAKSPSA